MTVGVFKGAAFRLGDGYVVRDLNFDEKGTATTIRLYDKDFKPVKEIGVRTNSAEGLDEDQPRLGLLRPARGRRPALRDRRRTGFRRHGLRPERGPGKNEIRLPLEPLKMTDALKAAVIKPIKDSWDETDPLGGLRKAPGLSRASTPGLDHFEVLDGTYVVRTYKYRQDLVEFARFDEQGRELGGLDLPFTSRLSNGILFCFYQGRYYFLRENPDEEVWELHAVKAW
ncbi:MAG: hypothetical protein MZU91_10885 [Desulfosudis oleivorans]|nr:hypothetical protein [Desulfosudis oleivorans]